MLKERKTQNTQRTAKRRKAVDRRQCECACDRCVLRSAGSFYACPSEDSLIAQVDLGHRESVNNPSDITLAVTATRETMDGRASDLNQGKPRPTWALA
jgi:hypothetical protein